MFTIYSDNANSAKSLRQTERNNEDAKEKVTRNRRKKMERCRKHWTNFCNITSIHGVKYLIEFDRPLYERVWWALVLAICLYFATIYAFALYSRWLDKTIERTSVIKYNKIVDIPLPALTFCNNVKATEETKSESVLSLLCGIEDIEYQNSSSAIIEDLIDMAPSFNASCQLFHRFSPVTNTSDCEKMFTRIITQNGVCYTFNILDANDVFREGVISHFSSHGRSSDWDPDKGYKKNSLLGDKNGTKEPFLEGPYPKRAISAAVMQIPLETLFNGSFCQHDQPGLMIAVHSPLEIPAISQRHISWILMNDEIQKRRLFTYFNYNFEYAIEVDPEHTWTRRSLEIFEPNQRKCYYNGEKYLNFFKFYTQTNCENECLINHTLKECGCVDFYMPHMESTHICSTVGNLNCVVQTVEWWERKGIKSCYCYPSCNELNYKTYIWAKNKSQPKNRQVSMKVQMYTIEDVYISIESNTSQWTIVELLASIGGVFSLFCGMSLIGLVEFVYYGTVRLFSDFWRRRHRKISVVN